MCVLLCLPEDALKTVLDFTKTDSYLLIGTVCRAFRDQYSLLEKITRRSRYTQSPALFDVAIGLNIRFESSFLLDDLISRDEIEIIPRALSRGVEWDHFCVQRAAEVGSFRFFRWLMTTALLWLPENAHFSAASSGNLGMMKFLVESGAGYPDQRSFRAATELKHYGIVGWLQELHLDRAYVMTRAARDNDVDVFEQSLGDSGDGGDHHAKCITHACINGSFDVLEFYRLNIVDLGPTRDDFNAAVHFHRSGVVDWMLEYFPEIVHTDVLIE